MGVQAIYHQLASCGLIPARSLQVFTEADFAVGKQCNINGCDFLIYGCDEFTRDYYEKVTPSQCSTQPPPPPP